MDEISEKENDNMEKRFLPFAILIFILSTIAVAAIGQNHLNQNPGEKICVESRSCAINYMNKLEEEQE